MDLTKVEFPLFKLRAYISIDKNPLGVIKVTTVKGIYILDDLSINEPFVQRRLKLHDMHPKEKIYSLKERVSYLRQLVKYKSGSKFIDYNGNIIKYSKSSKLYDVVSCRITRKIDKNSWTIFHLEDIEIPFLVAVPSDRDIKFASIMHTKWGPFLYDLTSEWHKPYKRKI